MSGAATAGVLLGQLASYAATPDGQRLLERLVKAIHDGLTVDLVVSRPTPYDPVLEMIAAELERDGPTTERDPLANDGKET